MSKIKIFFKNYNTILKLDMFCRKEGNWTKVPYVQLFFFLRDHPKWLNKYRLDTQTMVTFYKKPPGSLEEQNPKKPSDAQGLPTMSKGASPVTEIKSLGEPQGIYPTLRKLVNAPSATPLPQHCPTGFYPLQLIPGGDRAMFLSD
jgi:hypothetical protein